jgi:V/A-type H+-transporting ATPase subunit I
VVHIVEKQQGIPDDASNLRSQIATSESVRNTIDWMQNRIDKNGNVAICESTSSLDAMDIVMRCQKLKIQEEELKSQQQTLIKSVEQMSVWGNFDLQKIAHIANLGYAIKFYSCRLNDYNHEWEQDFNAVEISRSKTSVYFITLTDCELAENPQAEEFRISSLSLNDLQNSLQAVQNQLEDIYNQINTFAAENIFSLKKSHSHLLGNIDISKVHLQIEKKADENLILLEGWAPIARDAELVQTLETQDVWYLSQEPNSKDDTVPVLLKNNRFARLFEPITKMYDLPNYHELDLTPFFAPFYLLFFGLCLADTGYGILFLLGALIARKKLNPDLKPIFSLAAVLGAGTIVLGFISGTFFGIELLDVEWAWIQKYKSVMLDSDQMFNLALILGVVQILFGMIIKAIGRIMRYGIAHAFESIGWLILLIVGGSLYLFYGEEMFFTTARYLAYAVLGISAIFILVLNTPGRNPLINIGEGIWNSFNMIVGLVGDVLSYIRLFALGLCGGVMGLVFNDLAADLSGNVPVISQLIMIVILLFGHSINIFMSSLGAFVHPLRLTFVEFYKSSGFQGRGKVYNPLKIY